jgi:hypothetical protein
MNMTESERLWICNEIIARINKNHNVYSVNDAQFNVLQQSTYAKQNLKQGSMILHMNDVYMLVGGSFKKLCLCDL